MNLIIISMKKMIRSLATKQTLIDVFSRVLLLIAVVTSLNVNAQSLLPQYAGPIPNLSTKTGYVVARSVVLDPQTGQPILVEFDAQGNDLGEINLGGFDSVNDVAIVSAADYFFFKQQLEDFRRDNASTLALGSELLSRREFRQTAFVLADNETVVQSLDLPEGINSVLVRGQSNRSLSISFQSGLAISEALNLLQFTFDFTQEIEVLEDSVSLLVNREGQVVAQSSNRIGYRVGFFGDASQPQNERGFQLQQGDQVFGPVPGVRTYVDEFVYPGGQSVTNEVGYYGFEFVLPTCPVGGFSFTTDVWAELSYSNFLPTGAPSIPYYLRTPGYTYCFAAIVPPSFDLSEGLIGLTADAAISGPNLFFIDTGSATSSRQSNLFVDVTFLNGTISLKNSDGSDVELGETTYTTFEEPAEQVTQQFYDFNNDGIFDHVEQGRILLCTEFETPEGEPLPDGQTPEEIDVFLRDSDPTNNLNDVVEHFTCIDTNQNSLSDQGGQWQGVFFDGQQNDQLDYPDLVRVIDQQQRFDPVGVIKTISEEDLRNTDILLFRESTGQLILERRGLKQAEASYRPAVQYDEDENQVAYRILLRGENDSSLNIGGGIDRRQSFEDWATDYQLTEPFIDRQSDHPRPGEIIKVVAINRATGYMGSVKVPLLNPVQLNALGITPEQSPSNQTGNQEPNLIGVEVPEITLLPPNLRVWAERNHEIQSGVTQGEQREFTIGNEGSALTSDATVTIFTEWLSQDGSPLPVDLGLDNGEQYGLTGRLARVVAENQLADASIGSDVSDFAIAPGRQTQVLRIQDNSVGANSTEHFYVHVIGKPMEQECVAGASCPSFDVTNTDGNLIGRPSLITPFFTPLPDEDSTWVEFTLFRDALTAFEQNSSGNLDDAPQAPQPSYIWQYRPEYQFSQYGLEIEEINRGFTNQEGDTETENILNSSQSIINSADTTIDIFYSLIDSIFDRLTPIDGDQDLVISFAGNEQLINIGGDQTITFDNLDNLGRLNPEDFLNILIYNNNDAANILYEFQFEAATSISLTRTISLARFNNTQTSTGDITDTTDSFEVLPIVLNQPSIVNVEVLDENLQPIGFLLANEQLDIGDYGVIVTYADMLELIENEQTYYIAVNQIGNATGSESRALYTGRLRERVDSELLGQTIEHDTLLQRGALTLRREDIELVGLGPQLNFVRSYSNELTVSNQDGPLGPGWTHNHNLYLEVLSYGDPEGVAGNNLPVWTLGLREDDKPTIFDFDELPDNDEIPQLVSVSNGGLFIFQDGAWRPSRGFHGDLEFINGRFTYISKDGTRYEFSSQASNEAESRFLLEQIVDRNDNALTYEYQSFDARQLVSTVTDATDRRLIFNYEFNEDADSHRLTSVNSPETGIVLNFDYSNEIFDEENISVNAPLISVARDNYVETYAYSKADDDNIANLVSTTDPVGNVTSYNYLDSAPEDLLEFAPGTLETDIVSRVDYPGGLGTGTIDYDDKQRLVSDLNGNIKTYTLNDFGNTTSIQEPLGRTTQMVWTIDRGLDDVLLVEKTDALNRVTTYEYDARGNMTQMTDPIGTVKQTWNQQYSVLVERTDRNDNTMEYRLDARGNVVSETDAEGFVTGHTYADNGLRLATQHPSNGGVTNYSYDEFGNVERIRLAEGSTTAYVNDSRGNPLRITDPNGNVSTLNYDGLDRLLVTRHPDDFTSVYTYDAKGNKLTEKDKLGLTVTYEYDPRDRVSSATRNFGGGEQIFTYDNQSNLLTETDWLGQVTTHTYDLLHRRTSTRNRIGDTMTMGYDLVDNLLSSKDYRQLETTYTYDDGDRKVTQTNPANDQMVYTYDLEDNVLTQTDYENRLTRLEYDKRYLLVKRTNPIGGEAISTYDGRHNLLTYQDEERRITRFAYDRQNRQTRITDALNFVTTTTYDANSNVTNINDRRGFDVSYEYDSIDRETIRTDEDDFIWRYSYDANDNKTSKTDGNGHVSTYEYDLLNRVIEETTAVNGQTTHTYDANNNRLSTNDAIGTVYTYTYDELDRVEVERHAVGTSVERTQTTTYDPNSNALTVNNFRGFLSTYRYDVLDRVDQITDPRGQIMSYTYDGVDNKLTSTDKRSFTTTYEYDDLDRLILMTDPLTQTIATSYDEVGNALTIRDKRGTSTTSTYDKLNRLLSSTKPDGKGVNVQLIRNQYDGEGNVSARIDANDNRWEFDYNGRDLLIDTTNPDLTHTLSSYDGAHNKLTDTDEIGQVTTYTYDDSNRQVSASNFASETTQYQYDLNNNQTRVIYPLLNEMVNVFDPLNRLISTTDGNSNTTTYEYDGNDNQTAHVDANLNRVSYEYDELDRKIRHNQPGSLTSSYSYDPDDNMVGHTDKNGQNFTYTYDAINRQTSKVYPAVDSPFMRIDTIVTAYDPNNNPVRTTETKFNTLDDAEVIDICDMEYDLLDRQTQNTQRGHVINYVYDPQGNRRNVSSAGGSTAYGYDSRNRLITATTENGTSTYTYSGDSKQLTIEYPNNTLTTYAYDNADRTLSVVNSDADNVDNVISQFDYTYDINGNRLTQTETQNGFAANRAQTTEYEYDNADRLTSFEIQDQDTQTTQRLEYGYDANYNRIQETETRITADSTQTVIKDLTSEFDGNNRLTIITDNLETQDNTIDYVYDDNGNTLSKTDNTQVTPQITSFVYDSRDQLTQVARGPPENQVNLGLYDYNYLGDRVRHLASERGDIEYIYDGKSILEERNLATQNLVAHYRYSDRLISLNTDTDEQYYHYSSLKTVTNLTNRAGQTQSSYRTDVWGSITNQQGSSVNRLIFTGQEYDQNTGLTYFGARYYDSATARFINEDTYLGESTTAPSLHRYLYVYAKPTVYYDPNGHNAKKALDLAVGGFKKLPKTAPKIPGLVTTSTKIVKSSITVAKNAKNAKVGKAAQNTIEGSIKNGPNFQTTVAKTAASAVKKRKVVRRGGKSTRRVPGRDVAAAGAKALQAFSPNPNKYKVIKDKFNAYKSRGGKLSLTEWAKRTRGQEWGIGKRVKSGFNSSFKVHGNSSRATGAHAVYVVRDAKTRKLLHFGETGRGFKARFTEHQKRFRKLGIEIDGVVLKTLEGKAAARALELRYIKVYIRTYGKRPPFNPVNH